MLRSNEQIIKSATEGLLFFAIYLSIKFRVSCANIFLTTEMNVGGYEEMNGETVGGYQSSPSSTKKNQSITFK